MLSHIEDRKGTKDGRGYPALSTRDFVVNNASSWRRTRRSENWQSVRSGWPLAISLSLFPSLPVTLCLSRAYPLTSVVSRSLFPCVPISLRNLSRINWFDPDVSSRGTPIGHRSHAARLVRFVAPLSPLLHPTGPRPPFFSFPQGSQIFTKVTWPNGPRRVNPRREDRREDGKEADSRSF